MTRAHAAGPLDLPIIAGALAMPVPNQAIGWLSPPGAGASRELLERFSASQLPWNRSTGLSIVAGRVKLRALAGGKSRGSAHAWEVDLLYTPEVAAAGAALDMLSETAARRGARRIFLRLPLESRVLEAARTAGFMPYATECLMLCPQSSSGVHSTLSLRVAGEADGHGIFRLYNRAVPQNVRAAEAVTLEEWAAAQNPIGAANPALFVAETGGEVQAVVRSAQRGNAVTFDILTDPSDLDLVVAAAGSACALLGGGVALRSFVPAYFDGVGIELERRGFERGAEFALLARQLAKPIAELAPARTAEEAAWIT